MKLFRPYPNAWQAIRTLLHTGLPQAMLATGESGSLLGGYLDLLQAAQLCFAPTEAGFACGDCRSCKLLAEAAHPDLWMVSAEPGKAIAIDTLRQGMEWIQYTPQVSTTRWLRIDHAEAMTLAAANAILKTLEEPPARAHVLLYSEQASRLLPTIRSRLQRIPLPVMEMAESRQWLQQQGIDADRSATLLHQLGNRPARALELWEAGWVEQRREWLRSLLDLPGQGVVAARFCGWRVSGCACATKIHFRDRRRRVFVRERHRRLFYWRVIGKSGLQSDAAKIRSLHQC